MANPINFIILGVFILLTLVIILIVSLSDNRAKRLHKFIEMILCSLPISKIIEAILARLEKRKEELIRKVVFELLKAEKENN